ncbi:MAG: chemotaxis protein CheW [Candidatus Eremiobacteraeota bacterium]|nr:chemotaxis protein CheW [Candidatus Eremiobacteraeota bacterium]MCW5869764.1 chemotaxis protein CheW [Candidatus Eremiobacteraeota bacterium]
MSRAEQIRRQFDESFRLAPADLREQVRNRLSFQLGSRSLSLPLEQVSEVLRSRTITPLPGSPPELLGLAGLRGNLVPVYRLADLMGISAPPAAGPLWILVVPQPQLVGLALEATTASLTAGDSQQAQEIDLFALVEEIQRRFERV